VAALYNRAYRNRDEPPSASLCDYFHDVFFSDPWNDLETSPSLVFVDDAGAIRGFIGTHPRRFRCGDRTINAVVMGQLMVEPRLRRRGIAWILGTSVLKGPQSLTFGTTASQPAAEMWRRMGFWNPPFAGLTWSMSLRAAAPGLARASFNLFVKPVARAVARRLDGERPDAAPSYVAPTAYRAFHAPAEWCELRNASLGSLPLHCELDREHAAWIWRMAGESSPPGAFRSCLVYNEAGESIGWVVYFVRADNVAQVLEIVYAAGRCREVLATVRHQAAAEGCLRIRGRCTTPELTAGAVALRATLGAGVSPCVLHTNDPDVRSAILNGNAFLSELDSESWLAFADR
jgi:hypothetical protein